MDDVVRLGLGFGVALAASSALTPLARRVALATDTLDHPVDYKRHEAATPYLGGSAVLGAFVIAALAFGDGLGRFAPLLGGAALLWAVGTLDDRRGGMPVAPRFAVQLGVAVWLWAAGLGWELFGGFEALELALTVLWVVGITNAANLMDNQDGTSGSVCGAAALGIGLLAVGHGEPVLGALGVALAGACMGFLPLNLAAPSRIFMGDGGSGPLGFLLAGMVMVVPGPGFGWISLLAAVPLVGLLVFDTSLVVISRLRRGAPVLSGGCDHIAHRMLAMLGTKRRVAGMLAAVQLALFGVAAALYGAEEGIVLTAGAVYVIVALGAIGLLETLSATSVERAERRASRAQVAET